MHMLHSVAQHVLSKSVVADAAEPVPSCRMTKAELQCVDYRVALYKFQGLGLNPKFS